MADWLTDSAARAEVKPDLIRTSAAKTAKVTLSDCLACSGCVTSAETVLITQQSADEFRSNLGSGRYERVVVTLSPQALASIAVHYSVDVVTAYRRLVMYFKSLGVHHVFDSIGGSNISLLETAHEFVEHHRRHKVRLSGETSDGELVGFVRQGDDPGSRATAGDSEPVTATPDEDYGVPVSEVARKRACVVASSASRVPLLSSACPGYVLWFCGRW